MHGQKEYIVHSPFGDVTFPRVDCYTYVTAGFESYGDRIGLVDSVTKESYTYARLQRAIDAVAESLHAVGFTRHSSMAVYATNCPEYAIISLGVWKLGGVVTNLNSLLTADDVKRELTRTGSSFLFCTEGQWATVDNILLSTPVQKVFTTGQHKDWISFSELSKPRVQVSDHRSSRRGGDTPQSIFFSSGTTGLPKGVLLTHNNFVAKLDIWRACMKSRHFLLSGYKTVVLFQPLSHIYGATVMLQCLVLGATCVLMPRFKLDIYLSLNAKYQCEALFLVPPLAVLLAKNQALVQRYRLQHVRMIFSGAAPLSLQAEKQLLALFPMARAGMVGQGYGMTETTAGVCTTPGQAFMDKHGSGDRLHNIGVPYPNHCFKIVDTSSGESLPPGQPGEICLKGPNVMLGYLNNKEATASTIDTDGWLHTGDIGYHDDRGYIYLIDRIKELIKYKGYQVAPAELEDVLLSHPAVADAGVVGVSDEEGGEVPLAFVVAKADMRVSPEDIKAFVAKSVAPYKRLRGGVRIVAEIPKSPSGKVLRREMKRQLALPKSNM